MNQVYDELNVQKAVDLEEYVYGDGGPIFLWVTTEHQPGMIQQTLETFEALRAGQSFTVVTLIVEDWFGELSPWRSPLLDEKFAGRGEELLRKIKEQFLTKSVSGNRPVYIMGYSLAGLFALWALHKEPGFSGAVSCSGSLWYPDFLEFLQEHRKDVQGKLVHLSIGGKEGNTTDPFMAKGIPCTKEAQRIMTEYNTTSFVLNKGGHFADEGKRLSQGMAWVLTSLHVK